MVHEANVKQAAAEKQLKEAQGKVCEDVAWVFFFFLFVLLEIIFPTIGPIIFQKLLLLLPKNISHHVCIFTASDSQIDVLQAEVTALKTLVLTSTPSSPNRQLHPQLQSSGTRGAFKHGGGHVRNKSASGAFPSSLGKPEPSPVPIQPVAKEEREVTGLKRACVCGSSV